MKSVGPPTSETQKAPYQRVLVSDLLITRLWFFSETNSIGPMAIVHLVTDRFGLLWFWLFLFGSTQAYLAYFSFGQQAILFNL